MIRSVLHSFLTLFLILSANASALTERECRILVRKLAFLKSSGERTAGEDEFLRRYRNEDRFARWLLAQPNGQTSPDELVRQYLAGEGIPLTEETALPSKTINLTHFGREMSPRERPSLLRQKLGPWLKRIAPNADPSADAYRESVLSLRAGDTVVFGKDRFVLGKFLGAGNATHVFEIVGFPDRVIRIPFLTESVARDTHPKSYQNKFVWNQPWSSVNRVQILQKGDGFLVVSRVNGTENGMDFIRAVNARYSLPTGKFNGSWVKSALKAANEHGDSEMVEKLQKLEVQMHKLWRFSVFNWLTSTRYLESRQFTWDTVKRDWYLVDWE